MTENVAAGAGPGGVISGADAFKLCAKTLPIYLFFFARFLNADCRYDSLGFPADLTCLVAKQSGWGVDMEGFDAAMQQQRDRARLHWTGSGDAQLPADVRCVVRVC